MTFSQLGKENLHWLLFVITSVVSVTNKYVTLCVCACVSHDAFIKLQNKMQKKKNG